MLRKNSLITLSLVAFFVVFGLGVVAPGAKAVTFEDLVARVQWQKDLVKRLTAKKWMPPEGWEIVKGKVPKLIIFNSGSLKYDPATEVNGKIFTERTGIDIEWIVVPDAATLPKEISMLTARSGRAPVVYLKPEASIDFYRAGWVEPVDFLWSKESVALYPKAVYDTSSYKGRMYGSPWFIKATQFVYRKDLLKQYVGTTRPPQTWQEIIDYAKKLTLDTNNDGNIDIWGYVFNTGPSYPRAMKMRINEGLFTQGFTADDVLDDKGIPHYNTPEGIRALQFLVDLVQVHKVSPRGVATYADKDTYELFLRGKVAMMQNHTWINFKLIKKMPQEKWGVSLLPKCGGWKGGPEGVASTRGGVYDYAINAYSKPYEKLAAALWLDFMRSFEACKNQQVIEQNQAPMSLVYDDPEVREKTVAFDVIKQTVEVGQAINYHQGLAICDILTKIGNKAILGDITAKEALDKAQKQINNLFFY
ncbi:MAG: sugar ABC transporter substrate-binding protein [Deltaproteobacteria bacterium]|nr:sugar ABC transporter substrate-binding protein [Deltaproteobacteria bacterium]